MPVTISDFYAAPVESGASGSAGVLRNLLDFRKLAPGAIATGGTFSETGAPAGATNGDGLLDPHPVVSLGATQEAHVVDGAYRMRDDVAGLHSVVQIMHADATAGFVFTPHGTLLSGWYTMRLDDWQVDPAATDWSAKCNLTVTDEIGDGYILHAHREHVTAADPPNASILRLGRDVGGSAIADLVVVLDEPLGGPARDRITLGWTTTGLLTAWRNGALVGSHQVPIADRFDTAEFVALGSVMEVPSGTFADVVPAVSWLAYTSLGAPLMSAGAV